MNKRQFEGIRFPNLPNEQIKILLTDNTSGALGRSY